MGSHQGGKLIMEYPIFSEPRLVNLTLVQSKEIIHCQIIAHGLQEAIDNANKHFGKANLNAWGSRSLPGYDGSQLIGGPELIPSKWDKEYPKAIESIKN